MTTFHVSHNTNINLTVWACFKVKMNWMICNVPWSWFIACWHGRLGNQAERNSRLAFISFPARFVISRWSVILLWTQIRQFQMIIYTNYWKLLRLPLTLYSLNALNSKFQVGTNSVDICIDNASYRWHHSNTRHYTEYLTTNQRRIYTSMEHYHTFNLYSICLFKQMPVTYFKQY